MTSLRFYRFSLLAPLVLPIVLAPLTPLLIIPFVFGGVQYAVFALFLAVWLGRLESPKQMQKLAWWSPVLFIPVCALGWCVVAFIDGSLELNVQKLLETGAVLALWVLVFGYGYVAVVMLAYQVAKSRGKIEELAL